MGIVFKKDETHTGGVKHEDKANTDKKTEDLLWKTLDENTTLKQKILLLELQIRDIQKVLNYEQR